MCNKNSPKVPKFPARHPINVTAPPGYELRTYGVIMEAETEGDLYEMIVGRRSAVLDEADADRDSQS